MNTHLSNIDKYITSHLEENTSLLQRFVREPSVQGNEAGVQRLVSKHLESLGMEVETWELISSLHGLPTKGVRISQLS
jgi:acetylornithine deacetylase/succinyl-diaminopimelate desuccinylase-like protein